MALLACPIGQASQKGHDFIAWVDRYMKADATSEYQYVGIDVYAARCAVSMPMGASPTFIARRTRLANSGTRTTAFIGRMRANLVIVSIAMLIRDFGNAVVRFMGDLKSDPEVRRRFDSRIHSLLLTSMLS